jgi:hypothetical protein
MAKDYQVDGKLWESKVPFQVPLGYTFSEWITEKISDGTIKKTTRSVSVNNIETYRGKRIGREEILAYIENIRDGVTYPYIQYSIKITILV